VFVRTLKTLAGLTIGISIAVLGLSATMAFGMFAWLGVPILVVGLGAMSAAIEELERH
jgi:hypothetical protein